MINYVKPIFGDKKNLIYYVIIVLIFKFVDIQVNTILILGMAFYIHHQFLKDKDKKINKKDKEINKGSNHLLKIFDRLHKFKKFNPKSYNNGKKHYNNFLYYIEVGDKGADNLKHVYDLAVNELNESLNLFISITVSLPAYSGYKDGNIVRNLQLDHTLNEICSDLYKYSIDSLEHLTHLIHKDWENNKNINSSYIDKLDLRLPKASNFKDILYSDKFSLYNL